MQTRHDMNKGNETYDTHMLREREKELRCIYAVDDIIKDDSVRLGEAVWQIAKIVPFGFLWPAACRCKITVMDDTYALVDYEKAAVVYTADIVLEGRKIGEMGIGYIQSQLDEPAVILEEEARMAQAVARRISHLVGGRLRDLERKPGAWRTGDHWHWRHFMAQQIADSLDMERLGVKAVYLFGSTDRGENGACSDIDLILHITGDARQRELLENWLDGWSRSLAKINYLHTGYNTDRLLDAHMVTDADIENNGSYAIRIKSVTEPATLLRKA